jgi:hypothetical protein
MGLGTACKEETSRVKMFRSRPVEEKNCLRIEEDCVFTDTFIYITGIIITNAYTWPKNADLFLSR